MSFSQVLSQDKSKGRKVPIKAYTCQTLWSPGSGEDRVVFHGIGILKFRRARPSWALDPCSSQHILCEDSFYFYNAGYLFFQIFVFSDS